MSPADPWERLLVNSLARDFQQMRLTFLAGLPKGDLDAAVTKWLADHAPRVEQFRATVDRARMIPNPNGAMLSHIAAGARIAGTVNIIVIASGEAARQSRVCGNRSGLLRSARNDGSTGSFSLEALATSSTSPPAANGETGNGGGVEGALQAAEDLVIGRRSIRGIGDGLGAGAEVDGEGVCRRVGNYDRRAVRRWCRGPRRRACR